MKNRNKLKIFFVIQFMFLFFSLNAYSQPVNFQKAESNFMSCIDLQEYLAGFPEINCNFLMNNCEDCLGLQFEINFDTTMVVSDIQMDEKCTKFYKNIMMCLKKIKQKYNEENDSLTISHLTNPNLPINILRNNIQILFNNYLKLQKLNNLLIQVNERILRINTNLLWKAKQN